MANPVLNAKAFQRADQLVQTSGEVMSVEGTINKTAFLLLLVAGGATWVWTRYFQTLDPATIMPYLMVGLIGGLAAALVTIFLPAWARISAGLARKWTSERLREHWAPALDRAVAAYLDLLKRWAADGLADLRDEFESHSHPLLAQLSPDAGPQPSNASAADIDADLEWLRRSSDAVSTPDDSTSLSIPHQE